MTEYPSGFAAYIDIGDNGEPLIKMVFLGDGEATEVILTMEETVSVMAIVGESMRRAAVLVEMTTIFPEQRETILENLLFRWSGGPDGS